MEFLLENLRKHVTCSICFNTLDEPKTIACLHTFCCDCLKEHAQRSQQHGQFRCPECQARIVVPKNNGFDKLPTGFLQNDWLDLLAAQQCCDGSDDITCANCAIKSTEASFCFNCGKFLCPDCVNAHEILRKVAFKEHKLKLVKQFKREDYDSLLKRPSFCSQDCHEQEITRFFCDECQTCVCQLCIGTGHENHTINALDKAASSEKANIMAEVELMKEKSKFCSDIIRHFEQTALSLETEIINAKREVSQTAEQMIARIQRQEREIISALESTRASRMEELNSAKVQVKSLLKQVDQAVEFANNLIQRSSSSSIVQSYKILKHRFEYLNQTPVPSLPVCSSVKFVKTCDPGKFTLGFTTTIGATVQGISQDFQAGVEAKLILCPKLKGEVQKKNIRAKVAVEPSDMVRSTTTCQQDDGNFLVKFTSKEAGAYNIKVTLKSRHNYHENCFTIRVKEREVEEVSELDLQERDGNPVPHGIAVNENGLIAVSDCKRHCILVFDNDGNFRRKMSGKGKEPGELNYPTGLAYLNYDELLVADFLNHRIQQFNVQTGKFVKTFGKDNLQSPVSLCIDSQGRVAVADCVENKIQVFTKDGAPVFSFGSTSLDHPTGCIFHQNMFIVSDMYNDCLKIFNCSGILLYKIGVKGKDDGQLLRPQGLCIEKCGDHKNILVCDSGNGRIAKFSTEGYFVRKTVTKFQDPIAIATTPDNRVLVSDFQAQKMYILQGAEC